MVTETFDEQGNTTGSSITETRMTLNEVNGTGVVLEVDMVVEIAGKRIAAPPQIVKQGYHGELDDKTVHISDLGSGKIIIEGQEIPCRIEQVETTNTRTKTILKTHWSASTEPCVLKRQSVTSDLESGEPLSQSNVEVVALDMPCKVLSEIKSTVHLKTVLKHPRGTTITLSVTSNEIPGGVICHTAKELNEKGQIVRRSALELIDYDLKPREERTGLFHRWRSRLQSHRIPMH
ncbi:MAG: hypothetical protein GXY83_23960 [Rhodopirellula sp.]|nr:hypothetical protein [Rhodopirellula sp.]